MSTAAVTNTFANLTPADATEVNANFNDVVTFLNNSVVHRDGSKALTAALDAGGFKVSNLADGVADDDAVNKGQLDAQAPTIGAWTAPTLTGSWANFGAGRQDAEYRKIGDIVYVRGAIKSGSSTAFTLPSGFRPPATIGGGLIFFSGISYTGGGWTVNASGAFVPYTTSNTEVLFSFQFSTV